MLTALSKPLQKRCCSREKKDVVQFWPSEISDENMLLMIIRKFDPLNNRLLGEILQFLYLVVSDFS